MNKFCHNCGKQMPTVEAKFCPFCGTSLLSLSSTPTPPPRAQAPSPTWAGSDDDDDDSYIDRIPRLKVRIDKLDVEIIRPPVVQGEKLGAIAAKESAVNTSEFRNGPYQNLTPEQALEQFKQEAGSRVNETRTHKVSND